jgi:hypothetical protein
MIPAYMLRRIFMPGGTRLAKTTEAMEEVVCICPTCSKAVIRKKMLGAMQTEGIYHRNTFYHYQCVPAPPDWWRGGGAKEPKGNLGQEEYRFWIGYREEASQYAMCRACRRSVYSTKGREAHFKNEECFVGGDPCSTRLVKAYKALDSMEICIVCKKRHYGKGKWGVPLCESPECHSAWKFGNDRWVYLETQLEAQRRLANAKMAFEQAKGKNDALIAHVTQVDGKGVETTREYCRLCHLFMDNAAHAEIHAAYMASGGDA